MKGWKIRNDLNFPSRFRSAPYVTDLSIIITTHRVAQLLPDYYPHLSALTRSRLYSVSIDTSLP